MDNEARRPDLDTLRKTIDHKMVDRSISSRKALAREAGVPPDTFDNLFKKNRKQSLYADDLYLIAKALDCTMEELLTGERPEPDSDLQPALAEMIPLLNQLESEQLVELRGVIRYYVMRHFQAVSDLAAKKENAG